MRDEMRRDLVDAIVRRDRVAVSVLRSVLAVIDNADAGEDRQLNDVDVDRILAREIDERAEAAARYRAAGQREAAAQLAQESALLRDYRLGR